jgi:hypothetical protein
MIKSSEQTLDPNPIGIKQVTEISYYLELQKESNSKQKHLMTTTI